MTTTITVLVVIGVIIALVYDFLNGMNDSANSIATVVSTKVLSPLQAVIWAAFFNFSALFVFKTKVAHTIGASIVNPDIVSPYLILAALLGAGIWVFFCTKFGLPISVSHALIGGLIGPALLIGGVKTLVFSGIFKVLLFIVLSPLIGFVLAYLLMILTMLINKKRSPRKVDFLFRFLQLLSSAIFSLAHGSNDAQKTMGVITVLLFSVGMFGNAFPNEIPLWIEISCYSMISLGTLIGGWKVIKTLGGRLTDLKPVQGFCAETAGALTVIGSSVFGIPVSTTHTITGSIMGVGVTRRFSAVRWGIAGNIVVAWVLTIPGTIAMSMLIYWIISLFV